MVRQVCTTNLFCLDGWPIPLCLTGTGKTMLVKAVANATTASFIRVVGSEFVQKYLGEVCEFTPSYTGMFDS